jgi:hypothetical protein
VATTFSLRRTLWDNLYEPRKILKYIMVQLDNARPHKSEKSAKSLEQFRACRVLHPDYGPDLTLGDFFLFGHVKSNLPGLAIRSREDLICEIRGIFKEIPKVTFVSVCASWIKRLKWIIKNNGDCFH